MRLENQVVLIVLQSILQEGHNAEKALKSALRGHGGALGAQGRACVARRVLGTCCLRARLVWGLQVLGLPPSSVPHLVLMYTLFQEAAFLSAAGGEGAGEAEEEEQWWQGLVPEEDAGVMRGEAQSGGRGVLRDDVEKGQWPTQPLQRLAAQASLPLWLAELWLRDYGLDDALALGHATNRPGGTVVRVNGWRYPNATTGPKEAREALACALLEEGAVERLCPTAYSPWGLRLLVPRKVNVWGATAFQHGGFDVQDEGSQLVALSARPGLVPSSSLRIADPQVQGVALPLKVVDVCAGRGGKTLALLQLLYEQQQQEARAGDSATAHDVNVAAGVADGVHGEGMGGVGVMAEDVGGQGVRGGVVIAHDVDGRCLRDLRARLARAPLPLHAGITVTLVYAQQGCGVVGGRGGDVGHMAPTTTDTHPHPQGEEEGEGASSGAGDWSALLEALGGACKGDVVLVDGPCSSLGTLRRGPNVRWEIQPHSLAQYQTLQLCILEQAARLLVRPGGMLIYSTCTLRREENRDVADRALTWPLHMTGIGAGAGVEQGAEQGGPLLAPWGFDEEWAQGLKMRGGGEHMLELLPHVHNSDGFFIARFRRR